MRYCIFCIFLILEFFCYIFVKVYCVKCYIFGGGRSNDILVSKLGKNILKVNFKLKVILVSKGWLR